MEREAQKTPRFYDMEVPRGCASCGGPLAGRFGPQSAVGVCLHCRIVTPLLVSTTDDGIHVAQMPGVA
jgi:hypothetical protein